MSIPGQALSTMCSTYGTGPTWPLSVYDGDRRQLEAVCKRCHEALHPEGQRQYKPPAPPLTPERWD